VCIPLLVVDVLCSFTVYRLPWTWTSSPRAAATTAADEERRVVASMPTIRTSSGRLRARVFELSSTSTCGLDMRSFNLGAVPDLRVDVDVVVYVDE